MDTLRWLLVVSACSCVRSEPSSRWWGGEAGEGAPYEPVMFAAVPLHAPVPVLRVLSPARARPRPLDPDYEEAYEPGRPRRARPPPPAPAPLDDSLEYAPRPQRYEYAEYATRPHHLEPEEYAPAPQTHVYAYEEAWGEGPPAPTVLYARPSPSGGYTYRRAPARAARPAHPAPAASAPAAALSKAPAKNSPVIIKIHKYRIVKD